MKRRRSRNYFDFNTMVVSPHGDSISPEFALYCQKWTLRALIELGAHSAILHDGHCSEPGLIRSLGLKIDLDLDYRQEKVLEELRSKHRELILTSLPRHCTSAFMENITWLGDNLNLSADEKNILFFCVLERQSVYLRKIMEALGGMTNSRVIIVLSVLLEIQPNNIKKAFCQTSGLTRSGLVTIDESNGILFSSKVELIEGLSERLIEKQDNPYNLFCDNFIVAASTDLEISSFDHMKPQLERLTKYLNAALQKKQAGVNILVYGTPGTGKTMCSRAIAKDLGAQLFEVSVKNRLGDRINGVNRLTAYRLSQRILTCRTNSLIVFDEIEDIDGENVNNNFDQFAKRGNRSGQKGWFNQLLETNPVPAIWITNNVRFLDAAHLRRFDYHLHMDIPPARVRSSMLSKFTNGLNVSTQWCDDMATNEKLTPGLMARAAKVAFSMKEAGANGSAQELLEDVVGAALKVQKHSIQRIPAKSGKVGYELDAINADCNLAQLIEGLRVNGEGRLCLYGPPGTGKSAFAQHVARELGKPILLKRASDILGKYVGETEERMAEMFREASSNEAIIILDEADSFLRSRENASRSWEVSAVNEMLVQIEAFQGIFFATTNLMDQLDSASLRRFDAKINFKFLKFEQSLILFNKMCEQIAVESNELAQVSLRFLDKLTPGDFSNVLRQSRFRPMSSATELIDRLTQEISMKKMGNSRPMGFLASEF